MHASSNTLICVGKKKGGHSTKQDDINELLIKYAKEGQVVARLKGGDPMIFGRLHRPLPLHIPVHSHL